MTTPIVTLADYKTYATISSTTQDAQITKLIPQITEYIKSYCGRSFVDFYSTDKIEVFNGGYEYFPKEFPVVSVTKLEVSYDNGETYSDLTPYTDWVLNIEDDSIVSPYDGVPFKRYINGYRITYKGGFEDYPTDLKLSAMDLITYYMKADMAVKSTRSAGSNTTQIEYVMNAGLPSHIRRIFDLYKAS